MIICDLKYAFTMFKILLITKNKDFLNIIDIESRQGLLLVNILCFLYCFLCFLMKFLFERYFLFTFLFFGIKILKVLICFTFILSVTCLGLYIYCLVKRKEKLFD